MRTYRFAAAVAVLIGAGALWPDAAVAAADRVWVSGHGVDAAGCGAPTAPCRSLQYAHDSAVSAGGEIDILDPAGYGAVTITKAISIVNDGVGTAGVQAASGNAITINAGSNDAIYLRGLNIDGENYAGSEGVKFVTGGRLTLVNCVIQHFQLEGVDIVPTTDVHFLISDTLLASNHDFGLSIEPNGAVVIGSVDRVTASDNAGGVAILDAASTGSVAVALSNANISNNNSAGVLVGSSVATGNVVATLDNVEANVNGSDGLFVTGAAIAHLSRSVFNQNVGSGVVNNTSAAPGAIDSIGDNVARGNLATNNTEGTVSTQAPF